jgi:hypothetical protein
MISSIVLFPSPSLASPGALPSQILRISLQEPFCLASHPFDCGLTLLLLFLLGTVTVVVVAIVVAVFFVG